ncbi:MAG: surface-adhesin E family protein [Caulobacterales bacterium]
MRALISGLMALALVSCSDEPVLAPKGEAPSQAALPASCEDPSAVVTLSTTANQPDWLLFARQAGGGDIQFNRHSIRRCGANEAEITVRVRYDQPQLYAAEDEKYETTIRYHVEQVRYRYRCTDSTYTVLNRDIVDDGGNVVASTPGNPEAWRPATERNTAGLIMRTACLGR